MLRRTSEPELLVEVKARALVIDAPDGFVCAQGKATDWTGPEPGQDEAEHRVDLAECWSVFIPRRLGRDQKAPSVSGQVAQVWGQLRLGRALRHLMILSRPAEATHDRQRRLDPAAPPGCRHGMTTQQPTASSDDAPAAAQLPRPTFGQAVGESQETWASDIARGERRLELYCAHSPVWRLLAVVGRDAVTTDLGSSGYPDDAGVVEVNCMACRTRWQVSMLRLRRRVDQRSGLEKVDVFEVADRASWLE